MRISADCEAFSRADQFNQLSEAVTACSGGHPARRNRQGWPLHAEIETRDPAGLAATPANGFARPSKQTGRVLLRQGTHLSGPLRRVASFQGANLRPSNSWGNRSPKSARRLLPECFTPPTGAHFQDPAPGCCIDRNVRCRVEPMSVRRRAEISVPRLIARLNRTTPVGLHPRPGRGLARRVQLENSLRLAQLALKRHRFKGLKFALAAAKKGE
jgi:hypothetical protein